MIARTTRTICELLAASVLGVILLLGIAGWRLSQGPVPLDFLTPHFVRALNGHGAPFRVTIDKTNLAGPAGTGRWIYGLLVFGRW